MLAHDATWWNAVGTWALVAVGAGGTTAALLTLRTIQRQTTAMEDQLREMRDGSAKTERMISQAVMQTRATRSMSEAAREAAIATRDNAEAALLNAQALMNAERAWITARIEHPPAFPRRFIGGTGGGTANIGVPIRLFCKNDGKTPAWVIQKRAGMRLVDIRTGQLPPTPDLDSLEFVQAEPEPIGVGEETYVDYTLDLEGSQGLDDMLVIYGVIPYRDAFDKHRETRFGYRVTIGDKFERLISYPEYNKST